MSDRIPFEEFAASRAGQLFKIAYLMCGDWHQAQDLVQTALSNPYPARGRLPRGGRVAGLDAYARKTLLNCYISHRRLRRAGELPVGELPDRAAHGPGEESQVTLRPAVLAAPSPAPWSTGAPGRPRASPARPSPRAERPAPGCPRRPGGRAPGRGRHTAEATGTTGATGATAAAKARAVGVWCEPPPSWPL